MAEAFELGGGDAFYIKYSGLPSKIHSQVVSRAADKSRMRDFLFVVHVLSVPAPLFLQLLFQTPGSVRPIVFALDAM